MERSRKTKTSKENMTDDAIAQREAEKQVFEFVARLAADIEEQYFRKGGGEGCFGTAGTLGTTSGSCAGTHGTYGCATITSPKFENPDFTIDR